MRCDLAQQIPHNLIEIGSIAEWGKKDLNAVDAVEQILSKSPVSDRLLQIAVCVRHELDIDFLLLDRPNRPYRPAIAQREAMDILREGRGTQWDAEVVDAMIAMLDAPRTTSTKREAARG